MRRSEAKSARLANRKAHARSRRPEAEALEGRILLYSTVGHWTYSSRITYSFMPDGTDIAGTPSVLFQTLNAIAPTATWENQIEQAATPWETNAHLNLALVGDNGAPFGTSGNQQDDPRFGDIRIGAMPLASGVLAETFLPPPSNGGTAAGDIVFNSTVAWQIGGGYDLETVALHEFGHALGLGDQSTDIYGAMYYSYDGIKTSLDSDDIAGIQSTPLTYGAPQYDAFNSNGLHNNIPYTAPSINPYLNGNNQIALSNLDITTPTQVEYFPVTAPANGTGQMVVTVQSSNLSSLAPSLAVMNSSLGILSQLSSTSYGNTLTTTVPVTAGQKYYVRVSSNINVSYGRAGAYGLEVNFGTQSMPPIAPPNTVVPDQPDGGGGGTINALIRPDGGGGPSTSTGLRWTTAGGPASRVDAYLASTGEETPGPVAVSPAAGPATDPAPVAVGPVGPTANQSPTTGPAIVAPMTPLPAPGPVAGRSHSSHRLVRHSTGAALPGGPRHRGRPQGLAKDRPGQLGTDSLL